MALESATYIDGLVSANPVTTDGLNQGDDHLRLIKSAVKATFPNLTGAVTASQAELNLLAGLTSLIPSGVIVMWSGAVGSIPAGWKLCNGSNSTPDLRDRFIVGSGTDSGGTHDIGDSGGANSLSLSEANLPGHTHSFSATTGSAGSHTHSVTDPGHSHGITVGNNADVDNDVATTSGSGGTDSTNSATTGISIGSAGAHTHSVSGTTGSVGSGTAIDNRPAYYSLAFIMKE